MERQDKLTGTLKKKRYPNKLSQDNEIDIVP